MYKNGQDKNLYTRTNTCIYHIYIYNMVAWFQRYLTGSLVAVGDHNCQDLTELIKMPGDTGSDRDGKDFTRNQKSNPLQETSIPVQKTKEL